MFGERLKLARRSKGFSLRDLAEKVEKEVSAMALSKYERDEMMPSSQVLMALCHALEVSESYLLTPGSFEVAEAEFRKHSHVSVKEMSKLKAIVLSQVGRYIEIEDILGIDSAECKLPSGFPEPVFKVDRAEKAADKLRQAWQLGIQPISNFAEILEENGIKLLSLELPSKISGMTMKIKRVNKGTLLVIVLNSTHSGERQRFSGGHELGHNMLDLTEFPKNEKSERACDRFSGAFWVPADTLLHEVGEHRHHVSFEELFQLKKLFGVSIQALIYRMKDLGIITDTTFTNLFIELTRRGWRKEEPYPIPRIETNRFHRLCLRAVFEEAIGHSKAAELLETSIDDVETLLDQGTWKNS